MECPASVLPDRAAQGSFDCHPDSGAELSDGAFYVAIQSATGGDIHDDLVEVRDG